MSAPIRYIHEVIHIIHYLIISPDGWFVRFWYDGNDRNFSRCQHKGKFEFSAPEHVLRSETHINLKRFGLLTYSMAKIEWSCPPGMCIQIKNIIKT